MRATSSLVITSPYRRSAAPTDWARRPAHTSITREGRSEGKSPSVMCLHVQMANKPAEGR